MDCSRFKALCVGFPLYIFILICFDFKKYFFLFNLEFFLGLASHHQGQHTPWQPHLVRKKPEYHGG
jgi:hypothetical protein